MIRNASLVGRTVACSILACSLGCGGNRPAAPPGSPAPAASVAEEDAPSPSDPWVRLARVDGPERIEVLEVEARGDGTVFYCTGLRGLQIASVKDPARPRVVAELASSLAHPDQARCQHLARDGELLYVTHHGDMLQRTPFVSVFDLGQDPPVERAVFARSGYTFEGVAAAGGRAYVAMHDRGLLVLEPVLRPRGGRLVERGVFPDLRGARGVAVDRAGGHVYVAERAGSLAVLGIADPDRPALVSRIELGGSARAVTVHDTRAYVALGAGGLAVVSVADPTAPALLSRVDTGGAALQVAVAGDHAYVANWTDARVYDVADPRAPLLLASEDVATHQPFSRVLGIGAYGDTAFLGEWTGMYIYRLHAGRRAPIVQLDPGDLDYGTVPIGRATTRTFTVANPGRAAARVRVEVDTAGFTLDPAELELPAGTERAVRVTFTPTHDQEVTATITVRSDDPDRGERHVALRANRSGVGPGAPAPEIELSLVDGGQWRLSEQRGKVVVLAYFATFSPIGSLEFPDLEAAVHRRYKDRGVVVVGVDPASEWMAGETPATVRMFRDRTGVTFPLAFDDRISHEEFRVGASISPFPLHVVIDRAGRVAHIGRRHDLAAVTAVIDALLADS